MPDVFVSYSHQDRDVARRYADALQAAGLAVWWDDHLRSGESFDEKIEAALRAAKAVVVLWSKTSVASRWVRAEATLADRNKTLVPVMIEPCERPIMFELTHTSELGHWDGDPHDAAWLTFLVDVNRYVTREALAAPAPQTAPPPVATSVERGDVPSLAVMPFSNRSGLPRDDALAFGMVEDIIEAISHSSDLHVLSSGSTAKWAGKPADLRDVGRDLGARYVLEGNVRRAGANLRVTVQLVEAESVAILWSQKASDSIRQIRRLSPDTPLGLLLDNVVSFATSHGAPLRAAFIKVWDETPVEGER